MRAITVTAVPLVLGLVLACDRTEPRWAGPQQPPMSAAAVYDSPEAGFTFALPPAWQGGYRIDARHGGDADRVAPRSRHAVTFQYVPLASAVPEQVLLRILAFGRADWEAIVKAASETGTIVTAEEHLLQGGMGANIARIVATTHPVPMRTVGIRDRYAGSASPFELMEELGLTPDDVAVAAREAVAAKAGRT